MKYILRIYAIGNFPEIEISESEYLALKEAREKLLNGLFIEEKYEILISNYLEFEKELLLRPLQHMVRNNYGYDSFFDNRVRFNVKIVNLLTSARLYIDQLHRHVCMIMPESENVKENVKKLFSNEYDNYQEYRFMEALRNYAQHKGIPVHATTRSASREESDESSLVYSIEVFSMKTFLKEDEDFKKQVIEEIPEKINLKLYARAYVECISRVQDSARNLIEKSLKSARNLIDSEINKYKNVYLEELTALHAICIEEKNYIDYIPLNTEWDDIRISLTKRNPLLNNLKNRHVTTKYKR